MPVVGLTDLQMVTEWGFLRLALACALGLALAYEDCDNCNLQARGDCHWCVFAGVVLSH